MHYFSFWLIPPPFDFSLPILEKAKDEDSSFLQPELKILFLLFLSGFLGALFCPTHLSNCFWNSKGLGFVDTWSCQPKHDRLRWRPVFPRLYPLLFHLSLSCGFPYFKPSHLRRLRRYRDMFTSFNKLCGVWLCVARIENLTFLTFYYLVTSFQGLQVVCLRRASAYFIKSCAT